MKGLISLTLIVFLVTVSTLIALKLQLLESSAAKKAVSSVYMHYAFAAVVLTLMLGLSFLYQLYDSRQYVGSTNDISQPTV